MKIKRLRIFGLKQYKNYNLNYKIEPQIDEEYNPFSDDIIITSSPKTIEEQIFEEKIDEPIQKTSSIQSDIFEEIIEEEKKEKKEWYPFDEKITTKKIEIMELFDEPKVKTIKR